MTGADTAWVQDLWRRVRPHALAQATELEQQVRACARTPHGHVRQMAAADIAHQLSGSLGSYGLYEGSRLAVDIQRRLRHGRPEEGHDGASAATLATRLRRAIECS